MDKDATIVEPKGARQATDQAEVRISQFFKQVDALRGELDATVVIVLLNVEVVVTMSMTTEDKDREWLRLDEPQKSPSKETVGDKCRAGGNGGITPCLGGERDV
ncbi:hypothetical protein ACLOJK_005037 [Asimina triloba]